MFGEGIEIKPDMHVGMLFPFLSVIVHKTSKLLLKTGLGFFPLKVKRRAIIVGDLSYHASDCLAPIF